MIQKKYYIAGIIALAILIIATGVIFFLRDNRNVTFTLDYPDATAVISTSKDEKDVFATIENNHSLWLKKQTYYILYKNDELDHTPVAITVNDTTSSLTLDPNFSSKKLDGMFAAEKKAITTALTTSLHSDSPLAPDEGKLYHRGEWYATTIPLYHIASADPDIGNPEDFDNYYVMFKKEGSAWKLAAGPSLILTKPQNPSVPGFIIDTLNPTNLQY